MSKKTSQKITVSIRIDKDTKRKLQAVALQGNIHIGDLITELLDSFLDDFSNDYLKGYIDFINKEKEEV